MYFCHRCRSAKIPCRRTPFQQFVNNDGMPHWSHTAGLASGCSQTRTNRNQKGLGSDLWVGWRERASRSCEFSVRTDEHVGPCFVVLQNDPFLPLTFVAQCTTQLSECLQVTSGVGIYLVEKPRKIPSASQQTVSMVFWFFVGDVVRYRFMLYRFVSEWKLWNQFSSSLTTLWGKRIVPAIATKLFFLNWHLCSVWKRRTQRAQTFRYPRLSTVSWNARYPISMSAATSLSTLRFSLINSLVFPSFLVVVAIRGPVDRHLLRYHLYKRFTCHVMLLAPVQPPPYAFWNRAWISCVGIYSLTRNSIIARCRNDACSPIIFWHWCTTTWRGWATRFSCCCEAIDGSSHIWRTAKATLGT